MNEQTERGSFEREFLKKKKEVKIWRFLFIFVLIAVGGVILGEFAKDKGAEEVLIEYADNGLAPFYLNMSGNITLTYINLNDFANAWCQNQIQVNLESLKQEIC